LTRTRSLFAAAVLALSVPAAVAGCGDSGGSSDEDPQDVIDATFNNDEEVSSGVLDFSLDASAGDQGSFNASLSGPFVTDPDDPAAIPQLDLDATASAEGAGQSFDFDGGVVVTEDNAFVDYQGQTYEVGTDNFKSLQDAAEKSAPADSSGDTGSFKENCEQALEAQGGDTSVCDVDISAWFTNLSNDGTEDVEGTETTHVSGDVDTDQLFDDLVSFAQAVPGAASQVDTSQFDQAKDATTASFDLYSGTDDDILRKLDLDVTIDPSAIQSATPIPVDSIDFGISATLSGVNEDQTIEAPEGAKPIEDLLGQFGLSGLGPLSGGLGGTSDLGGGSTGLGGSSADYQQCIQDAGTDAEAAAKCLDEL